LKEKKRGGLALAQRLSTNIQKFIDRVIAANDIRWILAASLHIICADAYERAVCHCLAFQRLPPDLGWILGR
jgi:hypothetical protein